jgi:hypothetical protein
MPLDETSDDGQLARAPLDEYGIVYRGGYDPLAALAP